MNLISEMGDFNASNDNYKILVDMEEFAEMGKIDKLTNGANTFRSFGLRFIFVVQNTGQLLEIYGNNVTRTFLSSGAVIKGGDNNHDDNKLFSERLGEKCVIKIEGKGEHRHKKTTEKPLMKPDEIRMLNKKYWLVLLENEQPLKLKKLWDERDYPDQLSGV